MMTVIIKDRYGKFDKRSNLPFVAYNEFILKLNRKYPNFMYANVFKDGKQIGSITQKSFPFLTPAPQFRKLSLRKY